MGAELARRPLGLPDCGEFSPRISRSRQCGQASKAVDVMPLDALVNGRRPRWKTSVLMGLGVDTRRAQIRRRQTWWIREVATIAWSSGDVRSRVESTRSTGDTEANDDQQIFYGVVGMYSAIQSTSMEIGRTGQSRPNAHIVRCSKSSRIRTRGMWGGVSIDAHAEPSTT